MSGVQGRQWIAVEYMARGWWRSGYNDAHAGQDPRPPKHPDPTTDFRADYLAGYAAGRADLERG